MLCLLSFIMLCFLKICIIIHGLFHVIRSLIILIASFVRGYIMMLKLHEWSQEIWSKNVIFKCKNYVPHLLFHVQIVFFRNSFFHQLWFHNTVSEHVFIPEINPHCILSQMYALFIEFYYALFFKDMHYNTMV
jgi:hypothetical protein